MSRAAEGVAREAARMSRTEGAPGVVARMSRSDDTARELPA